MRVTLLIFVALAAPLLPRAGRAAPIQVPYSGQLAEDGELVNGTRSLEIRLYDVPTSGAPLATQTGSVDVVRGVFHTVLTFDDSVWSLSEPRWIGIAVDGDPELSPRVQIGFVPFAVRALTSARPEPGVNFAPGGGTSVLVASGTSWTLLDTVGVTVPDDGYVWVTGTGWVHVIVTTQGIHNVNVVLSETTPLAAPPDQIVLRDLYSTQDRLSFSQTQVFPVAAGHHVFGLYVRQTENLGGLAPGTNFARATLQAHWIPKRYP
jgi:hypothetical protein